MVFGKHINKYFIRYSWLLLLGLFSLAIVDYGVLKVPEFYRMVVNGINDGQVMFEGAMVAFDIDFLLDHICLPLIYVVIMIVAGRFLWRVCFFGSAIYVEIGLRDEMFDKCKRLPQQYYQVNKVGNLMSLFTNDVDTVQECFGDGTMMFCDCFVQGGMCLYKMARMNWTLALLSLIPVALLLISGFTVGKYMSAKWDERQEVFSKLSDYSQESFSGLAVIKAFAKETRELLAFKKLNKENEKVNIEFVKMSVLLEICVTLFVESMVAVILGYGGYLVYTGVFNAGEVVEYIGYFTAIVWPIMSISMQIDMHARGKASLTRINELLDAPIELKDADDCTRGDLDIKGGIEFNHLTFTYPGSEVEVLHDVTFSINPGENIGIIGPTGCGKTTIVDLIARVYNVPDNSLLVDGVCVNRMPIKHLRDAIAYVPQDNFLFSETIASNIAFAFDDDTARGKIEEAAKMSDVHKDIVDFADGYDTLLGERGVTVSGGQKQRISIARALMKNAQILILDDSVSAVDTKTERLILDNLRKERQGKTTILIAHRVSTIQHMDKILLMDDGRIIAYGTHDELMNSCDAYAQMVEDQRLEDEENA